MKKRYTRERSNEIIPNDVPLLRNNRNIIDKLIGSENELLAEKRLTAIKEAEMLSSKSKNKGNTTSGLIFNGSISLNEWIQLGPTSIPDGMTYSPLGTRVLVTGRITSIAVDPKDANTIYIGAAQGGIWKTRNSGKEWVPISDNQYSLAIGALAIDESNTLVIYAGTGEGNFAIDSQYGIGMIKSTDGGTTWQPKAIDIFLNSRFCRLAINPRMSATIFAATTSSPNPRVASGIYRSTDGGENWLRMERGLPLISSQGATDILLNPSNPDIAYAAFWGEGIYKTIEANVINPRWIPLTSVLPSRNTFTRIAVGISNSSPNTLYALMADTSENNFMINKLYVTTNGGNSWKQIPISLSPSRINGVDNFGGQGAYNMNIAVHPLDENIVYISGMSIWKAIYNPDKDRWDFSNIGEDIHPDNHAFAFDPENPNVIYTGNDGGIYRSKDAGNIWDDSINKGLCITQFEFMEQHPNSDNLILAGTQDNGTVRYEGSTKFYLSDDGDGGFVCIDPNQPDNIWHTYNGLTPVFSDQGGRRDSWKTILGLWPFPDFGNPSLFLSSSYLR